MLPRICFNNMQVAAVYTGSFHSGALTSTGELFLWGMNYKQQTGNRDKKAGHVVMPSVVGFDASGGENFIAAAASNETTLALTASGRVLICGEGSKQGAVQEAEASGVHEVRYVAATSSFVDITQVIQETVESSMSRIVGVIGGRCTIGLVVE